MNCPTCNVTLQMTERQGIEIDYCPQCRGVWLDRGELDKIIERSVLELPVRQAAAPAPPPVSPFPYPERHDVRREGHYDKHHDDHYGDRQHKKRGFLSDLFD
jgi:Zn-finger nucleic acid-binding protein